LTVDGAVTLQELISEIDASPGEKLSKKSDLARIGGLREVVNAISSI
jgi:hypothetical protein